MPPGSDNKSLDVRAENADGIVIHKTAAAERIPESAHNIHIAAVTR
jgi:hypothetical protein